MSTINLSEGSIEAICNDVKDVKPVLQVIDLRLVTTLTTTERYRLLLSDGVHIHQGMLAIKFNGLVKNGILQKGTIIQLRHFVFNKTLEKPIIIMSELEVIQETCAQIGEPKHYAPPNTDSISSSVGQARVVPGHGHAQQGKPHATSEGPTYYQSDAGTLQQPKSEYGAQMQSNGTSSAINPGMGCYVVDNGPLMCSKSEFPAAVSGSVAGGGSYGRFNNARTDISRTPASNYTQHQQPPYQQQPPMYMNKGPIAKNVAPPRIVPIAALNSYDGRWTIKARVTAKGGLRHFNNARADGKLFSFDLLDSDGGEIRAICFNAVVDQFYDLIELGNVYQISKGTLKPAQKKYNHLRNDHEIHLDPTSVVQPCYDDDSKIPRVQFNFCPISDIEGMDNQSVLDVIGVVFSISPTASIMTKHGETQKRSLQLKDMSGRSVELTMWGNFCNAGQTLQSLCDTGNFPVLAVKVAKVSEFNGKALGTFSSSQLFIEPDYPEARELRVWFAREGRSLPSASISRETMSLGRTDVRKTISQIKDEKLGTSEKADWITVCATLSFMKMDKFCYTACPNKVGDRQCIKKVTNNGDGKWRCDTCDQSFEECYYRYLLTFQIQDHTGLTWVTAFQEGGEELLGMSAKDLFVLKYDNEDDEKFQETIRAAVCRKYIMKLKVNGETYSDEVRIKSTVVKAEKVNFVAESKFLLDLMQKVKAGDSTVHAKTENMTLNIDSNRSGIYHTGISQAEGPGISHRMNPNFSAREMSGFNTNTSQYGNQYTGGYGGPNTSGMYATCTSCGGSGHNSTNCPSIINSPGQPSAGIVNKPVTGAYAGRNTVQCYKCHNVGHFSKDCPQHSSIPPAYGGNNGVPGRSGGVPRQHIGGF